MTVKQFVLVAVSMVLIGLVGVLAGLWLGWSPWMIGLWALGFQLGGCAFMMVAGLNARRFVERMIGYATEMAGKNLASEIAVEGNATMRAGYGAMAGMQANLREVLAVLKDGAAQVTTAASEIAAGNLDLSQRTEQGSADLQACASSMRQMTEAAQHSAEAMNEASGLSQKTSTLAQQGGQVVSEAVSAMSGVSASSRKIADIISVIDGIAFQTNILALNAAVEAARAGEQGRGFAVVAGEVRLLAQRSAEAAKEIKSLITQSVEQVDTGNRLVNDAGQRMQEVVSSVERVASLITDATQLAHTQSGGLQGIADSVDRLDQTMQQNAALVEQGAAAADSLKHQAGRLNELVVQFRLR